MYSLLGMNKYRRQWEEYKRLKSLYFRVSVVGWLLFAVFGMDTILRQNAIRPLFAFVIFFPVVLIAIYFQNKFFAFRCPRCGNPFDSKFRMNIFRFRLFARRCIHCGLPVYSD
jgi:hypothetical protein